MALTRAVVPGMKERRWGRIIHISSIMGFVSKEGRKRLLGHEVALLGSPQRSERRHLGELAFSSRRERPLV